VCTCVARFGKVYRDLSADATGGPDDERDFSQGRWHVEVIRGML
jgi:hypothetical protein